MMERELVRMMQRRFGADCESYLWQTVSTGEHGWRHVPPTDAQWSDHLYNRVRLGIGHLPDATTLYCCLDFDGKKPPRTPEMAWDEAMKVKGILDGDYGFRPLIERSRSGKGTHLWTFFSEPVPIELVIAVMRGVFRAAGLPDDGAESTPDSPGVYPWRKGRSKNPKVKPTGKAAFMPWQGALNGGSQAVLLDSEGQPLEDQIGALGEAEAYPLVKLMQVHQEMGSPEVQSRPELVVAPAHTSSDAQPPAEIHKDVILANVRRFKRLGLTKGDALAAIEGLCRRAGAYLDRGPGKEIRTEAGLLEEIGEAWDSWNPDEGDEEPLPRLEALDLEALVSGPRITPDWAMPGWVVAGEVAVLAGMWGAGKSMMALDMAFDMTSGVATDWLGSVRLDGCQRVLYLDEENPKSVVQDRLQGFCRSRGLDPSHLRSGSSPMKYLYEQGFDLDQAQWRAALVREIEEWKPTVVVMDSLIRFHCRDESSNNEMADFYRKALKPLARKQGVALIVLHHLRKPGKTMKIEDLGHMVRGASDIPGWADTVLGLANIDDVRTLVMLKNRWGVTQPYLNVTLEVSGDEKERGYRLLATRPETLREVIWERLDEVEGAGAMRSDLVHLARVELGMNEEQASKYTSRYIRDHSTKLKKRQEGRYMRYWLARNSPPDAVDAGTETDD